MIPYSKQTIGDDDIKAVVKVLKGAWLTQGPTVREFEDKIAKYCGAKYAVAFSSGTAGLQAIYAALGIKKGDEVIMSPLTFAATANALLWQGGRPVFVDIDESGCIDPRKIAAKINSKTKAIVCVDYAGLPCDYDAIRKIAKEHNLYLIGDAAHSLGAKYKGQKIGAVADLTMFSFHPVKSITTGEGGLVTTNSKEWYEKMLMFRSHGITKDASKYLNKSPGDWYHEMQDLGLNYRLTDIQAALGVSQMKKLGKFIKARNSLAKTYIKKLSKVKGLLLPKIYSGRDSAWHLFPLRLTGRHIEQKRQIFDTLKTQGIGLQIHYIPVYLHPYYQRLGYKKGLCPKAEQYYESEISIPVYPTLSRNDQEKVIKALRNALDIISK